jgi:hypothetical protein
MVLFDIAMRFTNSPNAEDNIYDPEEGFPTL